MVSSTAFCTQRTLHFCVSFERCMQHVFTLNQLPGDRKKESVSSWGKGKVEVVQITLWASYPPGPSPRVSESVGLSGAE